MADAEIVTILVTDLVESTRISSRMGPVVANKLLKSHFELLREAIHVSGGIEVNNLGDGLMVSFASPTRAIDCAVAIQQGVKRHNRLQSVNLAMRAGLALGECRHENGEWYGEPLTEAAELCAAARGDQILIADTVRVVAGRHLGHELVPVGPHVLRGVPDPVMAYEVRWSESAGHSIPLPTRLANRPDAGFVGREAALASLASTFEAVRDGEGHRLVLLAGEAGLGKTSVVAEAARAALRDGAIVMYGRCDDDLGIPYQAFREALGHYLAHESIDRLRAMDPQLLAGIAPLVPSLETRLGNLPTSQPTGFDADRWILFSAVEALLSGVSDNSPVVVVLDDIHWADRPSLQLLRHLCVGDIGRVLLIATYRDNEPGLPQPFFDALATLRQEANVDRLILDVFAEAEVAKLIAATTGRTSNASTRRLAQAISIDSGGNPFFVTEVVRHLVDNGVIGTGPDQSSESVDLSRVDLPQSVREVIGVRVGRVGDYAKRVLSTAAVVGQEFELGLVASALDADPDTVFEAMEAAATEALVAEVPDAIDSFRFGHALIQQTLYSELSPVRRVRIHRRVAQSLEEMCGENPGDRIGELARHHLAAATPADWSKAVHYARLAAQMALHSLAPDEAVRWYGEALGVLDLNADSDPDRAGLLAGLGDAQRQSGDPAFRQTLLEAGQLAQTSGDVASLVSSSLANNRGYQSATAQIDTERVAMLQAALGATGDREPSTRARLLAHLALELTWDADFDTTMAIADEALGLARGAGDRPALLDVLLRRGGALWHPNNFEALFSEMWEAGVLAEELEDPLGRFWAARVGAAMALIVVEPAELKRCFGIMDEVAARVAQPTIRWVNTYFRSWLALLEGDIDRASQLAREAMHLGSESGQPDNRLQSGAQMASIRWHHGSEAKTADDSVTLALGNPEFPILRAYAARVLVDVGRHEEARSLLRHDADAGFGDPTHILPYLVSVAEAVAGLGDRALAATIYDRLARWPSMIAFTGSTVHGATAHHLGALANVLGHYGSSEAHFAHALALHQRIGAPFFVARTHLEWGRMLLVKGARGDEGRARQHLSEAGNIARHHHYRAVEERSTALLALLATTS